ncbi:MAG: hypothetical protein KDK34_07035 [Leptospiraceae bacterium]|nr:hypothetical protein [Leptospiraceae bacterium]
MLMLSSTALLSPACSSAIYREDFVQNAFDTLAVTDLRMFHSYMPAAVAPAEIPGVIVFRVYRAPTESRPVINPPIGSCMLQHGYGIFDSLVRYRQLTYDTFVRSYFSPRMIEALLRSACREVYVTLQESAATTVLEMTIRTERFLRDVVCADSSGAIVSAAPERCAFIGHSKGGAVAYNIARRCMQQTSEMGADGCARLAEVYSANGVIQGSLATILGYGLFYYGDGNTELFSGMYIPENCDDCEDSLFGDYIPGRTNPVWVDVSPMAPMENNVPLYVVNQTPLRKAGWFQGEFSAAATDYHFADDGSGELYGCGPAYNDAELYNQACNWFGNTAGYFYGEQFRPYFTQALQAIQNNPQFNDPTTGSRSYLNNIDFDMLTRNDGLADYSLSMAACKRSLNVPINERAVQQCITYRTVNHLAAAGGGPTARLDIIQQLVTRIQSR